MEREKVGAVGTGKYEGYVWDGRHWVDPFTMKHGKFDPWQRTSLPWRIFLIAVALVFILGLSWPFLD